MKRTGTNTRVYEPPWEAVVCLVGSIHSSSSSWVILKPAVRGWTGSWIKMSALFLIGAVEDFSMTCGVSGRASTSRAEKSQALLIGWGLAWPARRSLTREECFYMTPCASGFPPQPWLFSLCYLFGSLLERKKRSLHQASPSCLAHSVNSDKLLHFPGTGEGGAREQPGVSQEYTFPTLQRT